MPTNPQRLSRIVVIAMVIFAVGGSIALSYFMHDRSQQLVRNLDSTNLAVVNDALVTLKNRGDPEAIPKSKELLKSENPDIRINAAIYLGAMEKPDSVPYLIQAMRDVKDDRKYEIISELSAMTGQSFEDDVNAWQNWWLAQHPGSFRFSTSAPSTTASPAHPDTATQAAP